MDLNLLYKHRPLSLLILFVSISLLLIIFHEHKTRRTNYLVQTAVTLFYPINKLTVNMVRGARLIWSDYIALVGVQRENRELRREIKVLQNLNSQYTEAVEANKRLRKLLDFKKRIEDPTISAEIIGKDSTNWCRSLLLDKGGKDGIQPNMPVVTYNGVVGKVQETTNHTAKVLLINDLNSSIAVLIQRNRAEGILVGTGKDYCTIKYLRREIDVTKGDKIITSGIGGIFPKGLIIGTVNKIQKNTQGLFQEVEVILEAQISKLEEVFIIKRNPEFDIN